MIRSPSPPLDTEPQIAPDGCDVTVCEECVINKVLHIDSLYGKCFDWSLKKYINTDNLQFSIWLNKRFRFLTVCGRGLSPALTSQHKKLEFPCGVYDH